MDIYLLLEKSNKEVAALLNLTEDRIKNIISALFFKLKVEDRTQLAVYSLKNNLIKLNWML